MSYEWGEKYEALREQCITTEKHNMKLMNRIYHIKRMTRRAQKERKAIMERLDRHHDDFRAFDSFFDADVLKDVSFVKPLKATKMMNKKSKNSKSNGGIKHEKEKAEKYPFGPKKPVNAYLIYCQHSRQEILDTHPEITHQELTKLLAKKWNQLQQGEKQMYYDMYEQDKERYEVEMEQYTETGAISRSTEETAETVSPTLHSLTDASGLAPGFALAQIPSPTLPTEDIPFRISTIASPSFH